MTANDETDTEAWYSYDGPENDVVLSTRVRLARNLANFPFPTHFQHDDAERVQTLVFDSFAHGASPERFQALAASDLDSLGMRILEERGVLASDAQKKNGCGIVMRTDGKIACTVNDIDHVRISAFVPGLDGDGAYALCRELDEQMQRSMQFAASYDFGFLTSTISDSGSGMKVSVRVHLPSISFLGKLHDYFPMLQEKGIEVSACFGSGADLGSSLGSYYQLATRTASVGSEFDQMAAIVSAARYMAEAERRAREQVRTEHPTELQDVVFRAYATAKFSSLMPQRESVDIIAKIKWGKDSGFLGGIADTALCALLYRVQDGHLQFVLKNGTFHFPDDIAEDKLKQTERLRAVMLQEAFEHITL